MNELRKQEMENGGGSGRQDKMDKKETGGLEKDTAFAAFCRTGKGTAIVVLFLLFLLFSFPLSPFSPSCMLV